MSEYVFKLPDLGEGTVEAEIVEWHVKPGDTVSEGDVLVDVMTDKANIEVPAPVDGEVLRTSGEPGDVLAVGSELAAFATSAAATGRGRPSRDSEDPPAAASATAPPREAEAAETPLEPAPDPAPAAARPAADEPAEQTRPEPREAGPATPSQGTAADGGAVRHARVITSPAIRRRAKEAGVDLHAVPGSGPRGRILRRDLDAHLEAGGPGTDAPPRGGAGARAGGGADEVESVKVIGVRRVIAERMSQSKREIPHFAYVEEVDVTELERLRLHLNETHQRRLTVLPLIAVGLIRVLAQFPQCNARFDAEQGILERYRPVHLGIATQTPDGLKVPVVRYAERSSLWQLAEDITRVTAAARDGKAGRAELSGSTITITSLGRMGGVVTTPVINYPEVGIIGVNKVIERPVVESGQVVVRTMMNLSSSFDHRFVDGFDAASMIQALKTLLEHPATLFLDGP